MKKYFESGRSIVEMLGALAIVGVLSIGGIAGYTYGMNKWRANVTVNDVNLRAVDLMSQLSQGHTPNLDAWETTSTAKYPISLNPDNAPTNYSIKVERVPFEVCNMIADMMPENVNIFVDNDTQECGEGNNILDFEYEGFEGAQGRGGNTDACPFGTSAEGLGGYAGTTDSEGNRCYCANADTKWDGTLSCVAQDDTCSSHADCNKDEYCQFTPTSCTNNYTHIDIPTSGVCQNLSECGEKGSNNQFWMSNYIYGSSCKTNWWTAQDICRAKGMTMVSLKDIRCEDAKNGTCTSDTLASIRTAGMTYDFWTTDLYEENNPNSCLAWEVIGPGPNAVINFNRDSHDGLTSSAVLCRK